MTIALGQASSGTVHATDAACKELSSGGYYYSGGGVPCQRYLVNLPSAGALTVRVEWGTRDAVLSLTGRVAPFGKLAPSMCCSSPLQQTYQVQAAGAFLIFVAWSGNRAGSNLTTSSAEDFTISPSFSAPASSPRSQAR